MSESFDYQPLVTSLLVAALVVSFWLIGLRICSCFQPAAPENPNPSPQGLAGLLEFALGRLALTGMVAHTVGSMLTVAMLSPSGFWEARPINCLNPSDEILLFGACVVYANCKVSRWIGSLIGKMKRRAAP